MATFHYSREPKGGLHPPSPNDQTTTETPLTSYTIVPRQGALHLLSDTAFPIDFDIQSAQVIQLDQLLLQIALILKSRWKRSRLDGLPRLQRASLPSAEAVDGDGTLSIVHTLLLLGSGRGASGAFQLRVLPLRLCGQRVVWRGEIDIGLLNRLFVLHL